MRTIYHAKSIPEELKDAYRTLTTPWIGKNYGEYIRDLIKKYDEAEKCEICFTRIVSRTAIGGCHVCEVCD